MKVQCNYRYDDGARCMYVSDDLRGDMCKEHAHLTALLEARRASDARRKAKLEEERRLAREAKEALGIGPSVDPTAPWCTCKNRTNDAERCTNCNKFHFNTWAEKREK